MTFWHLPARAIFQRSREGNTAQSSGTRHRIKIGGWRDDAKGPMHVVPGPIGRQRVHFVAPPADWLEAEIGRFLKWINRVSGEPPPLLKANGR